MDDVYHCNIEKPFNEIQQLNERYSIMNSQLEVYLARDEEEPTLKSDGGEGKCAFISNYLLVSI
jgi:hypothetical protein